MTDEELLAVLDMSEESLKISLVGMDILHHTRGPNGQVVLLESLADLAFRLRDEAKHLSTWHEALQAVWRKRGEQTSGLSICAIPVWWRDNSVAIDWIIAALIAKEHAKE